MSPFFLDVVAKIDATNYTAFTFFVGTMAMMAASVFFFFELSNTDKVWRTSVLVSGLITFIAAVHYYYMREYSMQHDNESPTFFRYVDWLLTVPLMCVEFYLITKKAGGTQGLLWKLIFASVVMLVTGYFGEAVDPNHAWQWGLASGIAYFYIVYLVWFGEVAKLAGATSPAVAKAVKTLGWFVLVGWAIYPLGYIQGTSEMMVNGVKSVNPNGGLFGMPMDLGLSMDVIYNIGDAINKIGFGLVIYALSRSESK